MADESTLRLEAVSVIVTAEYHNPSILNPDFLKSCKIVPRDWTVTKTFTTPPFSVVKYANGVEWTADQSRLTVAESSGPTFEDNYKSHNLMTAYLRALPHVPYRELGLNCRMSFLQRDPQRWLVDRFSGDRLRNDTRVRGMKLIVALETEGALCNVTLDAGERNARPCVVVDCNLHHAGPLDVDALQIAIERWPRRRPFVAATLRELLEGQEG